MITEAKAKLLATASEDDLQRYVEDMLSLRRWIWHHAGDSRRSTAGLPDIVAVRAPRVLFAELKSERGRLRSSQSPWFEELRKCPPSVEWYIWKPSDVDEIEFILR